MDEIYDLARKTKESYKFLYKNNAIVIKVGTKKIKYVEFDGRRKKLQGKNKEFKTKFQDIKLNGRYDYMYEKNGIKIFVKKVKNVGTRKRTFKIENIDNSNTIPQAPEIDIDFTLLENSVERTHFYVIKYVMIFPRGERQDRTAKGFITTNNIEKYLKDEIEFIITDSSYEVDDFTTSYEEAQTEDTTDPLQIRMYKSNSVKMDLGHEQLQIDQNITNKNDCCFVYLCKLLNIKYTKKFYKDIREICGIEDNETGLSINDLLKYCQKKKISIHAYDSSLKRLEYYVKGNNEGNNKSLIFVMANNHMYPITDKESRDALSNSYKIIMKKEVSKEITNYLCHKYQGEFDEIKDIIKENPDVKHIIIDNMKCLENIHKDFFIWDDTLCLKVKYSNDNNMVKFVYNKKTISCNPDYHKVLHATKILNIPFKNQNMLSITLEFFDTINSNHPKSLLNSKSQEFFDVKLCAIDYVFKPITDYNKVKSFDLNKCYENCLVNPDMEFCVFSPDDEVEKYDGVLKKGKYYIKNVQFNGLIPDGFYYKNTIDYIIENGGTCDILYQLIPSTLLPKDYFVEFVEYIYKAFPNKLEIESYTWAKQIIKWFIGCMYQKSRIKYNYKFSSDFNDFHNYVSKDSSIYPYIPIEEDDTCSIIKNTALWKLVNKTVEDLLENNIPIYEQIIQQSKLEVFKMIKKVGGTLHLIKTDNIIVSDCDYTVKDDDKFKVEQFKIEAIEKYCMKNFKLAKNVNYEFKPKEWNIIKDITVDKPFIITGEGGTGKTFNILELAKKDDRIVLSATTNKASQLLEGKTIDSLYNAQQIPDRLHIDEFSMLNSKFIAYLYKLKNMGKIITASCDFSQLPPVKSKRLSLDQTWIKDIFENHIHLTKNYRNTELTDLYKTCHDLDFSNRFPVKCQTQLHITYTNKSRIEINNHMMNEFIKGHSKILKLERLDDDYKHYTFNLCPGMPVIARANNKHLRYFNTCLYRIINYDDENIYLNGNIVISHLQFQTHFSLGFAITLYGIQGETIKKPFTIHQWHHLKNEMKTVAIGRSSNIEYINICNSCKLCHSRNFNFHESINKPQESPFQLRSKKCLRIINNILRRRATDEYCLKHTGKTNEELKKYLGIDKILPGYQIDHIKERSKYSFEDLYKCNLYDNIRIIPAKDNNNKRYEYRDEF